MDNVLYETQTITGVANATTYGDAIYSTEAQPKDIQGAWFIVSARDSNYVLVNLEREQIAEIIDDLLPLDTDVPKLMIPLNLSLPLGPGLTFGIQCGGTASNLTIVYAYTLRATA